jgi:tetratricopeptide (TPR) repeat protein
MWMAAALAPTILLAQSPPPVVAEASDENIFADYDKFLWARQFDQALDAAKRLPSATADDEAVAKGLQAAALLGLKRDDEAMGLLEQVEKLAPLNPYPSFNLVNGAVFANRPDIAVGALDRMIARYPDVVRDIKFDLIHYILESTEKTDRERSDDRRIALARLGYGGDTSTGDFFAQRAVEILARRGDMAGAAELVQYIDDPGRVEIFLIDRRYEALWPGLDKRVWPGMTNIKESSVKTAQEAYAADPENDDNLQLLIEAYREADRYDELLALRPKLPSTREEMAVASENMGWAVNHFATALHELGREEEADQLMAMLTEVPREGAGWRVGMIINRLENLVQDNKLDKALAVMTMTEQSAAKDGNDYARQLVRRLKYCTLIGLNRRADADQILPVVLSHAADTYTATVEALMCGGLVDQAEAMTLEAMKDDKSRTNLLFALQKPKLKSSDPSIWRKRWIDLRAKPRIAAEFDRLGRDLPERFNRPVKDKAKAN